MPLMSAWTGPTGQAHISGILWNRVVIQWDITESPVTRIILPTREIRDGIMFHI